MNDKTSLVVDAVNRLIERINAHQRTSGQYGVDSRTAAFGPAMANPAISYMPGAR